MALSITQCPKTPKILPSNYFLKAASLPVRPSFLRVSTFQPRSSRRLVCSAFSAAGSSSGANSDVNPYEVLGVNPLEGFDMVKSAYTKKRKDAERRGDEATAAQLESAYDKIMMSQLKRRKQGETFGSFKVSKDIKYADKLPVLPWGPRFTKSEAKDIQINMAISLLFTVWIFVTRSAEYKPLQFLAFTFVYRIFEKLKSAEPSTSPASSEDVEQDENRMMRMGKRLLRSLALVFGSVAFASVGYTAVLNVVEFATGFVPVFLFTNQELLVTASSALMLYVLASYYR